MKRAQVIGSTLRARPVGEKAAIVSAFLERFGTDLTAGRIRPVIHTCSRSSARKKRIG